MNLHSTRRSTRSTRGRAAIALGAWLALVAAGCSGGSGGSAAPTSEPPASGRATTAVSTRAPSIDGPPVALASVEGGDSVAAQLGTYTWAGTGSDAPWLQGAPMSVGPGEVLTVALDPVVGLAS